MFNQLRTIDLKLTIVVLDENSIQLLGISQEEYLKFVNLQMVAFGVPVHCRLYFVIDLNLIQSLTLACLI
jgi:hypothetical protein